MKTAITSSGNCIYAETEKNFVNATWFCLYNEETDEIVFIENEYSQTGCADGSKLAEKLVNFGIHKIVSCDMGENALKFFNEKDIEIVLIQPERYTIQDIIISLKKAC